MKKRFVLDCSMAVAWLLPHQATPASEQLLGSMDRMQPIIPSIWEAEITNVLLLQIRRRRITLADADRFMAYLRDFEPEVHPASLDQMFGEVFRLANQFGLSSYDAMYLNLALSLGLPLATLDQKLVSVATTCGVELLA